MGSSRKASTEQIGSVCYHTSPCFCGKDVSLGEWTNDCGEGSAGNIPNCTWLVRFHYLRCMG